MPATRYTCVRVCISTRRLENNKRMTAVLCFFQSGPWRKSPPYIVETSYIFVLAAHAVKVLRLTLAGCVRPHFDANAPTFALFLAGSPFRVAVPFWRQILQIISSLSPKLDCGPGLRPVTLSGPQSCFGDTLLTI